VQLPPTIYHSNPLLALSVLCVYGIFTLHISLCEFVCVSILLNFPKLRENSHKSTTGGKQHPSSLRVLVSGFLFFGQKKRSAKFIGSSEKRGKHFNCILKYKFIFLLPNSSDAHKILYVVCVCLVERTKGQRHILIFMSHNGKLQNGIWPGHS